MKKVLRVGVVCAAFFCLVHQAKAGVVTCFANAGEGAEGVDAEPCTGFGVVQSATADWPPSGIGSGVEAHASIEVKENQSLMATAQVGSNTDILPGYAEAAATLVFTMTLQELEYTGASGSPIKIFMYGSSNFSDGATASLLITSDDPFYGDSPLVDIAQHKGAYEQQLDIRLDTVYTIEMSVDAVVHGIGQRSASIDPTFLFVNPDDAQTYRLVFSDGIVNGGEAPLPAALPLFASGAGLIGFVGWRGRRRRRIS